MELLNHEALIIMRRRHGFLQSDVARIWNVDQSTVSKWERGFGQCPMRQKTVKNLSNGEKAYIPRRRLKLTQTEMAKLFNTHRYNIWLYESDTKKMTLDFMARSRAYYLYILDTYEKSK